MRGLFQAKNGLWLSFLVTAEIQWDELFGLSIPALS